MPFLIKMRNNKGQFVKGSTEGFQPGHLTNVGRVCPEEVKLKIGKANTGKVRTAEMRKKVSENNARFWLGKKRAPHTEYAKQIISEKLKGKTTWNKGLKGYRAGEQHHWFGRDMSGENNPNYKKDRSQLKKRQQRHDSAYQDWSKTIKKRDGKCRLENENCNGYLTVHHILDWVNYPEERYNVDNGITLCQGHHPRGRENEKRLVPVLQDLITKNH